MFFEVKPYQIIKLDDVIGFAMYPSENYSGTNGRTLYVHMRGAHDSFRFSFESEHSCKLAYRRLKKALQDVGHKMEDYDDGNYLY